MNLDEEKGRNFQDVIAEELECRIQILEKIGPESDTPEIKKITLGQLMPAFIISGLVLLLTIWARVNIALQ